MRISTRTMYDTGTQNLMNSQSGIYKLQNQMSTGRRIVAPSDDPVASAQALVVSQRKAVNDQFVSNQGNADSQLAYMEDRLSAVSDLLLSVRDRLVQAGNDSYTDANRKAMAEEIRQRYDELVGLANSADAMGNYLFAGFRSSTLPFGVTGSPGNREVTYQGDDGTRQLQVEASRLMDVTESGADVFMRVPQGNGRFMVEATRFQVSAAASNTGTAVATTPSIGNGYDGSGYTLNFTSPTTYDLTRTAPDGATTVTTGLSYAPGTLTLGALGQQINLAMTGTPATGDSFSVQPTAPTGTAVAGTSSVVSGYDGSSYTLSFTSATTYDLTTTSPTGVSTTSSNIAYTPSSDIVLGAAGQQVKLQISGTPSAGDVFTLQPSANRGIFETLDDAIAMLETPIAGNPVAKAAYQNQLRELSLTLDQAHDHVLVKQTAIGARRNELEALTNVGTDLDLQYQTDLSKLQDLDYTKAISEMASQQMVLQAAQMSFKQLSQLSLFNYL